jgi:hypothetical protein
MLLINSPCWFSPQNSTKTETASEGLFLFNGDPNGRNLQPLVGMVRQAEQSVIYSSDEYYNLFGRY